MNTLTGQQVRDTYGRLVQVIDGLFYDGFGNLLSFGGGGNTFIFNQVFPVYVWYINHNLNKYPSVSVVDSAGNVFIGDIKYIDENNLTVTFLQMVNGYAYCN